MNVLPVCMYVQQFVFGSLRTLSGEGMVDTLGVQVEVEAGWRGPILRLIPTRNEPASSLPFHLPSRPLFSACCYGYLSFPYGGQATAKKYTCSLPSATPSRDSSDKANCFLEMLNSPLIILVTHSNSFSSLNIFATKGLLFVDVFIFETVSPVIQIDLELPIFLALPPKCQDYRGSGPHLALEI